MFIIENPDINRNIGRYFLLIVPTNIENNIKIGVKKIAIPLFTLFLICPFGFIKNIKDISTGKKENKNKLTIIVKDNTKIEYFKNIVLFILKHLISLHY